MLKNTIIAAMLCLYVLQYFKFNTNTDILNTEINRLNAEIDILNNEFEVYKTETAQKLKKMEREILRSVKVRITFYAPSLNGINSDSNPKKTATMTKPIPGRTCAISRDLVKAGWLGRKIYIPGIGIRYASDIMGKSANGKSITKQIDICVGKNEVRQQAKRFKKTHVTANVLRK